MAGHRTYALCSLALAALLAMPAGSARASALPDLPEDSFTLGPSAAWVSASGEQPGGLMLGADFSYVHDHLWASAGARLRLESDAVGAYYPYVEAGTWLLLTVGIGYSLGLAPDTKPRHNAHLFVGLPVPLSSEGSWLPYVEPYYRPMWDGHHVAHEVGLLVKWLLTSAERAP